MEKGKSINVINRFLPLNLNFAIAQAAARPNTVFIGTGGLLLVPDFPGFDWRNVG